MFKNDKPKQSQLQKNCLKFKIEYFVGNANTSLRKTMIKFLTIVPKSQSCHAIIAQDEFQMFDVSNDEDLMCTSSRSSTGSYTSRKSIFASANGCQAHEGIFYK